MRVFSITKDRAIFGLEKLGLSQVVAQTTPLSPLWR